MASVPRNEATTLMKALGSQQLLNKQLSTICQVNGLKTSGNKADLQNRIINRTFPS
jgi:E3 SUMO-protein ligase PIAS1